MSLDPRPASRSQAAEPIDADSEPRSEQGVLMRLLDPGFGFAIWAAHFLAVYVLVAVRCAMAGPPGPQEQTLLRLVMVGLTVLALGALALHSWLRWRGAAGARDHHFLRDITLGHNAIAAVAMLWLLFPILETQACR